ncbi:MAG: isoprenylcysteine carboxylmethyltransferase family protein [Pseudomonadota bacterium]
MPVFPILLLLVALQRVAELIYARRNEGRLRQRGGVEVGAAHYPLFILLHGSWLIVLALAVPWDAPVSWPLIAAFLVLQAGRVWVIASLGPYWTTRIITVPGAPLVRSGPYRWLKHPNYLVVALEIPLLPLVAGQVWLAVGFGLANLALLAWRIRVENGALADRPASRRSQAHRGST